MRKKNWQFRIGLILIIVSVGLFISLPFIPFLKIDSKSKITFTTMTFILAELLFWSGGLLLGKELFTRYKSYFLPKNWFKKKNVDSEKTIRKD